MIYDYIHEIVTTLLVDVSDIPLDFQPLIYLFELYGVFIFMKWALLPVRALIEWGKMLSKGIINQKEWRPEWVRKQKRSLRNNDLE